MFTLENMYSRIIVSSIAIGSSLVMLSGCLSSPSNNVVDNSPLPRNVDGAVIYPREDGRYQNYRLNTQKFDKFSYGRAPTVNEMKAWDVDIRPDGTGLPQGEGNIDDGEALYDQKCAMCHGEFGTGGKGFPTLSGGRGTLKNQLMHEGDEPPVRTIGSYWPYASTLYWYIQTAMPYPNPKSLTNDETYSITAYLLSVNDITFKNGDDIEVLNDKNFKDVVMPNEKGFYPDVDTKDPAQAKKNMKDLLAHPEKYGKGERCMSNCEEGKGTTLVTIKRELTGFEPPLSTVRDLPGAKKGATKSFEERTYDNLCSACHASDAIGAPVMGDKKAWKKVLAKGIKKVYHNGINGINAMPPKGGADITDAQFKKVVDYIISKSK
jgi:cytochrome c